MNGDRIKAILQERKISQRRLADMAGYSENYLSKMLNDAPTHPLTDDAAIRIGAALNIDPWDLKDDFNGMMPQEEQLVQSSRRLKNREKRLTMLETFTKMFVLESHDSAT